MCTPYNFKHGSTCILKWFWYLLMITVINSHRPSFLMNNTDWSPISGFSIACIWFALYIVFPEVAALCHTDDIMWDPTQRAIFWGYVDLGCNSVVECFSHMHGTSGFISLGTGTQILHTLMKFLPLILKLSKKEEMITMTLMRREMLNTIGIPCRIKSSLPMIAVIMTETKMCHHSMGMGNCSAHYITYRYPMSI